MGGGSMLRSVRRAVGWSGCPAQEGSALLQSMAEDWELAEDEDEQRVPSKEEVQEAASDVLALTRAGYPFSETASSSNPLQENSNFLQEFASVESDSERTSTEPHPCNRQLVQQSEHNSVPDAFQLLPTDPAVQEIAISLASDEAVWNAVSKNENVLEFRQSFHKVVAGTSMLHEITGDSDELSAGKQSVFISAVNNIKTKLMDYMEKITELTRVIFGFVDKKVFAEKDVDVLGRTFKSSLLLSIAILLVVVVKRVLII